MRPTEVDLAAFMKLAYEKVGHRRLNDFSMWEVGDELGWSKPRTVAVYERLSDEGFFEHGALGGTQCISAVGMDFCEERFGADPGVQEERLLFIRAVYEAAQASTHTYVNIFSVGEALGLSRERASQLYYYWVGRYALEAVGIGGTVALTALGIAEVEEGLQEAIDGTVAEAPGELDAILAHTAERRYALISVDLVGHSTIMTGLHPQDQSRAMELYRGFVDTETGKRLGRVGVWAGDGAVAFLHGDGCQQRAVETALAILQGVPRLHNAVASLDAPMQVRVAVHTAFFVMPEDPHRFTHESVNLVCHLQDEAVPAGGLAVTKDIYRALSPELAGRFRERPERYEDTVIYDLIQDDGEARA